MLYIARGQICFHTYDTNCLIWVILRIRYLDIMVLRIYEFCENRRMEAYFFFFMGVHMFVETVYVGTKEWRPL